MAHSIRETSVDPLVEQDAAEEDQSDSADQDQRRVALRGARARGVDSLAFIEGQLFQAFIGTSIVLSILVLSGETDNPGWSGWCILDNIFLLIFFAEIVLRIMHEGVETFIQSKERWWNMVDTLLVVLGMGDVWILPLSEHSMLYQDQQPGSDDVTASILRFLRLLRLVRLARVLRMVEKLAAYMGAIAAMMGPFMLIITILFGFNLFVSIILTHILGHGEGLDDHTLSSYLYVKQVRVHFSDVRTSFFTLFQVITTDNWYKIAQPLIELDRRWRVFFVLFIAFCSWTMISILTAVASDNVISATSDRRQKAAQLHDQRHKELLKRLRNIFIDADTDGNGFLDKEEFGVMLETDALHQALVMLEITGHNKEDLYTAWEMLDIKGIGVLTSDEFVDGLSYLDEEGPATRHIVDIDYSIRRLQNKLESKASVLRDRIAAWRKSNEVLLAVTRKEEEVHRDEALALWAWRQWALKEDAGSFAPDVRQRALEEVQQGLPTVLVRRSAAAKAVARASPSATRRKSLEEA